ncbi:sce7726 family protein [Halalkalibacterium halodurans]|uniref:Sce7726 family protein n=1 Tax=Halalkalibacterium halodurans TaxID=86665 RepID=A0A0M0KMI8_ALKHA|nr:sce7726 family protein [Halalkalibacterium halodurans]MDY7224632.1 sce7726 family protein [Halalkalibacterium halodurans]MDY7240755.1 sce7726 family protein [Halalkalibacterium halodurans]TPE68196.1 sce7726 family protein [Halalkalibacterium halodurans]
MSNNIILNRIFTQSIFMELINNKENSLYDTCVRRYLRDADQLENNQLVTRLYEFMKKKYRNEYFYKNTLLNKLLLGRHSLNTTTALSEIPINKSKADFILINGKAIVYEIKTELDTFDRLDSQISDYYKAFNHVCVVTCESNYNKLQELLNDSKVGICVLTDRNTISTRKESTEDNSNLDHSTIFKILRKSEFENVLIEHYGNLPKTSQVKYYKECFKLFLEIDINTVYKYFIKELKMRNKIELEEFKKVPYELKFLMYFSNYNKNDYSKLFSFLNEKWRGN